MRIYFNNMQASRQILRERETVGWYSTFSVNNKSVKQRDTEYDFAGSPRGVKFILYLYR